jgi:hypothetical protein
MFHVEHRAPAALRPRLPDLRTPSVRAAVFRSSRLAPGRSRRIRAPRATGPTPAPRANARGQLRADRRSSRCQGPCGPRRRTGRSIRPRHPHGEGRRVAAFPAWGRPGCARPFLRDRAQNRSRSTPGGAQERRSRAAWGAEPGIRRSVPFRSLRRRPRPSTRRPGCSCVRAFPPCLPSAPRRRPLRLRGRHRGPASRRTWEGIGIVDLFSTMPWEARGRAHEPRRQVGSTGEQLHVEPRSRRARGSAGWSCAAATVARRSTRPSRRLARDRDPGRHGTACATTPVSASDSPIGAVTRHERGPGTLADVRPSGSSRRDLRPQPAALPSSARGPVRRPDRAAGPAAGFPPPRAPAGPRPRRQPERRRAGLVPRRPPRRRHRSARRAGRGRSRHLGQERRQLLAEAA